MTIKGDFGARGASNTHAQTAITHLTSARCSAGPGEDNEAKIKAAVEDRYKEWLAAENKKDAEVLTSFTTRMRSSCPQRRSQ